MTKKPTYFDLKESRDDYRAVAMLFVFGFIIVFILSIISFIDFRNQLQTCEDASNNEWINITIEDDFIINYKCEVLSDDFEDNLYFVTESKYYHLKFSDFNSYVSAMDRFDNLVNNRGIKCEVIK